MVLVVGWLLVTAPLDILAQEDASVADKTRALAALEKSKDKDAWLEVARRTLPVSEPLRAAVVKTLKRLGADRSSIVVISMEKSSPADLRVALNVIRVMRPKAADVFVAKLLVHKETSVRRDAALALAVLGPKNAEPELCRALEDPDRFVRDYAVQALRMSSTKTTRDALRARLSREEDEIVLADIKAALATQPP